jgi:hypothetical protein
MINPLSEMEVTGIWIFLMLPELDGLIQPCHQCEIVAGDWSSPAFVDLGFYTPTHSCPFFRDASSQIGVPNKSLSPSPHPDPSNPAD